MEYLFSYKELYEQSKKSIEDLNYVINTKLLPKGFVILFDEDNELITFQPKTNILFYVKDKLTYSHEKYYFQQPFEGLVRNYKNIESCNNLETEFPTFNSQNYLNLCNFEKDGFEGYGYINSLLRISNFPILMEAIGEENRNQIYNLLNSLEESSALGQRQQITRKAKVKALGK